MSKAKRAARTLERRRKRDKSVGGGSLRAGATAAIPPDEMAGSTAGPSTSLDGWYVRPPRKRLGALVSVGILLAAWLCYLFWLAMVSLPQRSS